MGFATDAIHAGVRPDPTTGAVMTPIYQTSTYAYEGLGRGRGYDYARTINPTRSALEENLAALEGGVAAYAFASGMSAIHAVTALLKAGDHVVCGNNVYGGTYRLFSKVLEDFGLRFSYVDTSRLENIEAALQPTTRMVYLETPTNPMMILTDLAAAARLCRAKNLISVVDNTFLTPAFQKPLALGCDIVVHSTTKFLNGHSDSVGGAVILAQKAHAERIKFVQNSAGAILSPFDSWLVLRGIKTLPLRMRQHDASGRVLADWLTRHPKVAKVYYPGLKDHPQHALAAKQATGFGGMISFLLADRVDVTKFFDSLKLCALAESLGGVETLVCQPSTMTHASVPAEDRRKMGLLDNLARISVGCEDIEDLIADLDQALKAA
ncbi:MAG TPA: PLP-dependent aspartate aminotransferase family protein [Candidatus Polarisedimenticolia bacterium]|jgi:cystathionine gamma-lyase/cystathionine beta-lyase/cystathionine gamma-lyase/homocysteine desulfhydrase|nr:PLP-dependent aspartate aminotransferase family protein [Candidatus Polarisedimenticolia bacterium]